MYDCQVNSPNTSHVCRSQKANLLTQLNINFFPHLPPCAFRTPRISWLKKKKKSIHVNMIVNMHCGTQWQTLFTELPWNGYSIKPTFYSSPYEEETVNADKAICGPNGTAHQ